MLCEEANVFVERIRPRNGVLQQLVFLRVALQRKRFEKGSSTLGIILTLACGVLSQSAGDPRLEIVVGVPGVLSDLVVDPRGQIVIAVVRVFVVMQENCLGLRAIGDASLRIGGNNERSGRICTTTWSTSAALFRYSTVAALQLLLF